MTQADITQALMQLTRALTPTGGATASDLEQARMALARTCFSGLPPHSSLLSHSSGKGTRGRTTAGKAFACLVRGHGGLGRSTVVHTFSRTSDGNIGGTPCTAKPCTGRVRPASPNFPATT